jgi:hypothetical protein
LKKRKDDDEEEQEAAIVVETEERPQTAILPTTPVSSLTGFKAHTHNSPPPESPKQPPLTISLSFSSFCSSFSFSAFSKLFFFVAEEELRGFPLRRAGRDGRERAIRDSNPGPVDVVQRRRPLDCHFIGVE